MTLDLYNIKYDREIIKNNIYALKLIDILKTQDIDAEFIVKYILNKKYQLHLDDIITVDMVLQIRTDINRNKLMCLINAYDSDDDSVDDFDTVMFTHISNSLNKHN
jgi:hypothetical protein